MDSLNNAAGGGGEAHFHLHRFHKREHIACLHNIAGLHVDRDQSAGDRRDNARWIGRIACGECRRFAHRNDAALQRNVECAVFALGHLALAINAIQAVAQVGSVFFQKRDGMLTYTSSSSCKRQAA